MLLSGHAGSASCAQAAGTGQEKDSLNVGSLWVTGCLSACYVRNDRRVTPGRFELSVDSGRF